MQSSAPFHRIPDGMNSEVIIYLLNQILGKGLTPQQLMDEAKCFKCIPKGMQDEVITYLLCAIASGAGGSCTFQEGVGSPVGSATPAFIGQLYHDTVADSYYRSTGLTAADWTAIGGSSGALVIDSVSPLDISIQLDSDLSIASVSLTNATQIGAGLAFSSLLNATLLDFPLLVTIGGELTISKLPALVALQIPQLTFVGGNISINDNVDTNTLLQSISFQALTTISGHTLLALNPSLSSFSCPAWIPTDGTGILFSGCALNAASVELILRRCVLAGVTTCTIDLSGGTNAGVASLNAQGQADVVTLGAQLTINP